MMSQTAFNLGNMARRIASHFRTPTLFNTALLVVLLCVGSESYAEWHYETHQIFGTNVSIQLWSEDASNAKIALEQSVSEMWRIHNQLSPYIEDSELSLLNKQAFDAPMVVSEELATLIEKSLFYGRLSNGAFDISFASLGYLYDYRDETKPTKQQIDELSKAINYRLIELNAEAREVRFLSPQLKIDLGGIAKGYAIDRVANILRNLGVQHAAITAGGDSRVIGNKLGQPWVVGVRNPRADDTAVRIPLEDFAISTSGDYERYFIDEASGERIHHIINPATGTSADELTSVSVIGPNGFDTDPLSTTVFVLGLEKGMLLIEKFADFDAVIIDQKGKIHFTSGLQPPD